MRDPSTAAIRLADYRPADFAIDSVELDFSLHPTKTRVSARLALRRNPAGDLSAPLVLDGDELMPLGVKLDGRALGSGDYEATPDRLTLARSPLHTPTKSELLSIDEATGPSCPTSARTTHLRDNFRPIVSAKRYRACLEAGVVRRRVTSPGGTTAAALEI